MAVWAVCLHNCQIKIHQNYYTFTIIYLYLEPNYQIQYFQLCIGYTLRCRSLHDFVRSVETEPRCVTNLYHGL